MIKKKKGKISWYEYELLTNFPHIRHAVVAGPISFCQEHGRKSLKALHPLGFERFSFAHLKHGRRVMEAQEGLVGEGDGLITDQAGLTLLSTHADCQTALFYDPVHDVIGNVHCGWRGSVANIYQETVRVMGQRYGSRPEELLVCISPSLGPRRSEFINAKQELPSYFQTYHIGGNYYDFWALSRDQLEAEGIKSDHLEIAGICTYNSQEFFSYRKNKTALRNCSLILKL